MVACLVTHLFCLPKKTPLGTCVQNCRNIFKLSLGFLGGSRFWCPPGFRRSARHCPNIVGVHPCKLSQSSAPECHSAGHPSFPFLLGCPASTQSVALPQVFLVNMRLPRVAWLAALSRAMLPPVCLRCSRVLCVCVFLFCDIVSIDVST